jgi:hypothetical protein
MSVNDFSRSLELRKTSSDRPRIALPDEVLTGLLPRQDVDARSEGNGYLSLMAMPTLARKHDRPAVGRPHGTAIDQARFVGLEQ